MKRTALIIAVSFICIWLEGQVNESGVPFIRNYGVQETKGSEQNWCITKDIFGNIYFGSQDRGVVRYDGTRWTFIRIGVNPRIFSLAADSSGIIYVGAALEFGYIQPGIDGNPEYVSLAERVDSIPEIRNIYSITIHKGKVHFLSPGFIYSYDIKNDLLSRTDLKSLGFVVAFRLALAGEKLLLTDNRNGIFEWKENYFDTVPGCNSFKDKICTVLLQYDKDQILIGTWVDGLFLFNYKTGAVRNDFISESLNDSLKAAQIYAGVKVDDNTFILGTTSKGLIVIDKAGRLKGQLNTANSDLRDDAIYAMYYDQGTSELWLSTYGVISKVYFGIPVTQFAEKQGIGSGVNEICMFGNKLYVSSDEGIYRSNTEESGNTSFVKLKGINTQVFPLKVINTASGEFLIAGTLNRTHQIFRDDSHISIESQCTNFPKDVRIMEVRKIHQSVVDPEKIYFGLVSGGFIVLNFDGEKWTYLHRIRGFAGNISDIIEEKTGRLWFLSDDPPGLYRYSIDGRDSLLVRYDIQKGIPEIDLNSLELINGNIYVCTENGILKYDTSGDRFITDNKVTANYSANRNIRILYVDDEGDTWVSGYDKRNSEALVRKDSTVYQGVLNLLPDAPSLDIRSFKGKVYFLKSKSICVVEKSKLRTDTSAVKTFFTSITIGRDSAVMSGSFYQVVDSIRRIPVLNFSSSHVPQIAYDFNDISFEWTTPSFIEENLTAYSYRLEGYRDEWSDWDQVLPGRYFRQAYTNLPYGKYTFRVKTRTLTGQEGNELAYDFIIRKPWYSTIAAITAFILVTLLLVYLVIKAYTQRLRNENIRLEGIVAERTRVVVRQKEELESSIHYASRIQQALLPSQAVLSENIRQHFVLFKPRDIVSGDFYWITRRGERLYIVAADCTGHGVPGAFMSLLGMSFLDEIIDKESIPSSDSVLRQLRLHVIESLKQAGENGVTKDGMDISLLVLDFEKRNVEFSGAYNPCFRVRKLKDGETILPETDGNEASDGSLTNGKYLLETINADKMPIGISPKMSEEFTCNVHPLQKGYTYYLFSDGYIDQFGGPAGRKFMKKNFKKLLLDIQGHSMERQKELLEENMNRWRGDLEQLDDILVMGILTD